MAVSEPCGFATAFGLSEGSLACSEQIVHDLGAGGDDGSQFAAVDDLGGAGGGVPGQARDLLDADAAFRWCAGRARRTPISGTARSARTGSPRRSAPHLGNWLSVSLACSLESYLLVVNDGGHHPNSR